MPPLKKDSAIIAQIELFFRGALDNFKSINDVYGHSHGDRFLQQTSLRLRTEMRQTDHLFRLGGDEFIILLEGFDSDGDIVMVLEKLVNTVSKPLPVSTAQVSCKPSIGIVLIPKDSSTFEEATKRADLSMYEAKRNPNTNHHFYNAQTELEILEKYQLENDLSQALDNHELTVHFQPIINLADNRTLGAEALIRWNHPAKGLISPESFIPIAEKIGIIDRVSRFVIESSCDLISAVQASNPNFYVSVNITPTQLQQENLLKRLTHDTNVRYFSFLKFEVTESHFMEHINTMRLNVEQIQNLGVEFYLDDFGTGYSNIGNLQKLAFKTLKIDRSFTKSIHQNTASEKLVHGIALMTKRLGLDIVAEGVESGQEADRLRSIGITRAHGYHWSRPVDATVFLTLPGLSL
jgi:diguanylate cyclase (GGDEF)-like protein